MERRYLANYNVNSCESKSFDVVIIGAGIAGLYTALMLSKNLRVAVLSKKDVYDCDSYLAQGGIAASIQNDDRQLHVKDTINAGCYVNDLEAVNVLVNESEKAINDLVRLGVKFDKNSQGNFYRSFEGNHSIARILHVNGDSTGKAIMEVLVNQAKNASNIEIIPNIFALDIVDNKNKYCGIMAFYKNKVVYLKSKCCIIASGGIGQLFSKTTNVDVLTGDGIAMAIRAKVTLEDMEYIQFHPTALYSKNNEEKMFLISEAVRGEGAVLKNKCGSRFMKEYDSRMELAPRDIVARAISDQMKKTDSNYVYLDATMYEKNFLKNRFNKIYSECEENGIEIYKDYIPVTPAEHYFMGGIKVDLFGRASMENLYAVGECACTGVHGANRLASNSLMEALVFGKRVAEDILNKIKVIDEDNFEDSVFIPQCKESYMDFSKLKQNLKILMENNLGIVRRIDNIKSALEVVDEVLFKFQYINFKSIEQVEVYNMYEVARSIIMATLESKTSIGSNYIEDYSKDNVVLR
ncbi:L-aspartate oxidase [Clostridium ljungdahlii DSM 13528]|uniref:L-aspartate oxidase n=1 Tax=Clostridium ljungdahlii (strain ATCC 55383 / DSM 13528 / PETC) TaxID=748727 RepID=A0ABX2TRF3_CLOLD|nr:L-aspartate oxidase [Clostridium ljungdahlii]OAA85500.1 L-aspartate oxidase [Clostridium ljungdahlii DSM 13528]